MKKIKCDLKKMESKLSLLQLLFLNKGNWNAQQFIPEQWIEEATSPKVKDLVANDDKSY